MPTICDSKFSSQNGLLKMSLCSDDDDDDDDGDDESDGKAHARCAAPMFLLPSQTVSDVVAIVYRKEKPEK